MLDPFTSPRILLTCSRTLPRDPISLDVSVSRAHDDLIRSVHGCCGARKWKSEPTEVLPIDCVADLAHAACIWGSEMGRTVSIGVNEGEGQGEEEEEGEGGGRAISPIVITFVTSSLKKQPMTGAR